ncbi:endonuclease/exonuclease/phosphatase family protein [Gossypium australe]|uniref:Endonuclease/exonuclease/phosphatase family protein n=1 Tax=Gossypium australe TaxID=47621 RepID=A0A5B6W0G0_9ROSI|nr:endonuclease/exonuclease/phosphatase family protein [Gossypium australe]
MNVVANWFKARFIVGRNITDNIIIVPEVIHSMISKQKNRNWMALKIDLEKAYDRINWEFIDVLWNEVQTQKFKLRVSNLRTNLGVPLFHERVTNSSLRFVVDTGSSNEGKKMAMVSWNFICQPRSCGGLGLRQMRDQNTSFGL